MRGVIETKQLTYRYGRKTALDHVNITLNENQLIGLIGRNGSGKTTFLKLCAGYYYPTDGEITVFEEEPFHRIESLGEIIYSNPNVYHKELNTLEQILKYFKLTYPRFDAVFANKLLVVFALQPTMRFKNLSQGMVSVFNFICALSTRARLTLFDEPILGMDVTSRKKIYEILLRDYIECPRTIIVSSHILSELEDILSEILLIDEGKIILYKDLDEVRTMSYRIDGTEDAVKAFCSDKTVIYSNYNTMNSYAVIEGEYNDTIIPEGEKYNVAFSKVRPEDYCVYKTLRGGEADLECLWER